MDRLSLAAGFACTLALLILDELFGLHDRITGGGPEAELRRFLAAHPDATVHDLTDRP